MNMDDFLSSNDPIEYDKEVRNRIQLSIAAYAYEIRNESIMDDAEFDRRCNEIDLTVKTDNKKMDRWWKKNFDPSTGQWIQKHPEIKRIGYLYEKYYQSGNEKKA